MSDAPFAGQPGDPGQPGQPSEEELRQYVTEMRQAHAGELVAQVVSILLNGAQVKLGREDARMLLDLAASVNDQAGPHLDEEFTGQVGQVLDQLRMAQVEAEKELQQLLAEGQIPPEQNDLGSAPQASAPSQPQPQGQGQGQGQGRGPGQDQPPSPGSDASSRLWTPGG